MAERKNVVVAVRVRPLSAREQRHGHTAQVTVSGQQTTVDDSEAAAGGGGAQHQFTFDHSYGASTPQAAVFADIGSSVLDHAFMGYHCCVFAYGQTGSGKSHTMMGSAEDPGLIPRICQGLFARISGASDADAAADECTVEVSYLEIYNEHVYDLLAQPQAARRGLRVREHPQLGPYVEDLTQAAVDSYAGVAAHMGQGNRMRTVAATQMNAESSRSHAVFTVTLAQQHSRRLSRIRLVDLAGSERAAATAASSGVRRREGAQINRSLAALGKVIAALSSDGEAVHVPYRDSALTWLLRDSLGGNSRTFMVAAVAPASVRESLSTLRYAQRAKRIVNRATVNEQATPAQMIRSLQAEVLALRRQLAAAAASASASAAASATDAITTHQQQHQQQHQAAELLAAREKLVAELNTPWADKLRRTQALQAQRELALAARERLVAQAEASASASTETGCTSDGSPSDTASEPGTASRQRHRRRHSLGALRPRSAAAAADTRPRGQTVSLATAHVQDAMARPARARSLAQLVYAAWRRRQLVAAGAAMLRNAVHVKEANVAAKELGLKAVFQLALLAAPLPASPLEHDALPAILGDSGGEGGEGEEEKAGVVGGSPSVHVRVLDIASAVWYAWPLDRFLAQLARLRMLASGGAQLHAGEHLRVDPLGPAPAYACLGTATHPLFCSGGGDSAARPYAVQIDAPLVDPLTLRVRGHVRGSLALLPRPRAQPDDGQGALWTLIVHVARIDGLDERDVTDVHCVLRLAGTAAAAAARGAGPGGRSSHSQPLRGFGGGAVNVQMRQQWALGGGLAGDGLVAVDVFARARPPMLRRLFVEDVRVERALRAGRPLEQLGSEDEEQDEGEEEPPAVALSASQRLLVGRVHEEELFVDSRHELAVWLRVLELAADGSWQPAAVAPSTAAGAPPGFTLRQGLQRRIVVTLAHSRSRHLRVAAVAAVRFAAPQPIDDKGRLLAPSTPPAKPAMVALPVVHASLPDAAQEGSGGQPPPPPRPDNRVFVRLTAAWDSSLVGSRLLDAPTPRGMRLRVPLEIALRLGSLGADPAAEPLVLRTCMLATVADRQPAALAAVPRALLASLASVAQLLHPADAAGQRMHQQPALLPPADPVFRMFSVTLSPTTTATPAAASTDTTTAADYAAALAVRETVAESERNLWRLNTAKKYVRGEEALLPWRPRSVRLVDAYQRHEHRDAWRMHVARTHARLAAQPPPPATATATSPADALAVRRALADGSVRLTARQHRVLLLVHEAGRKIAGFRCLPESQALHLQQEPPADVLLDAQHSAMSPASQVRRRPLAVEPIEIRAGPPALCGWVDVLDTMDPAAARWRARWLVVQRPYVFVFADRRCSALDNVVNIASARVAVDPHVCDMLGRPNVLALYAASTAHMLSPPAGQMQQWIAAIDEWFFLIP
ncbi:hypothetical protein LPJ53_003316 [Coemansia erecta]|uniref:Kinesin motor domain-containing protein n=1 Tax=Coemansia erecta TaxID=147472 RepID=A0A9W7Y1F3_9FUNG|nr:hypothetical protein LPJ53_003316 [Coemansia erecta]